MYQCFHFHHSWKPSHKEVCVSHHRSEIIGSYLPNQTFRIKDTTDINGKMSWQSTKNPRLGLKLGGENRLMFCFLKNKKVLYTKPTKISESVCVCARVHLCVCMCVYV